MALNGVGVDADDFVEGVKGDVSAGHVQYGDEPLEPMSAPYVVIAVAEEFAEDVDGHDAETAVGFDFEDGEDGLVEDRVADVLGRVGVRGDL